MQQSNFQARRATVDDLVELRRLWTSVGFSAVELERRLTEFQVADTPDGRFLGAIGFRIAGQEGLLHSVACCNKEVEEEVRRLLWERVRTLSRNFGLYRIWTAESDSFWERAGFSIAAAEQVQNLPGDFGSVDRRWFVLKLREETVATISLEKEFELFAHIQKQGSERLFRQAQLVKNIVYLILFAVLGLGLFLAVLAVVPKSAWKNFRLR